MCVISVLHKGDDALNIVNIKYVKIADACSTCKESENIIELCSQIFVICNLFTFRKSTIEYGTSQVIQNKLIG
jgi:hypothetical protein